MLRIRSRSVAASRALHYTNLCVKRCADETNAPGSDCHFEYTNRLRCLSTRAIFQEEDALKSNNKSLAKKKVRNRDEREESEKRENKVISEMREQRATLYAVQSPERRLRVTFCRPAHVTGWQLQVFANPQGNGIQEVIGAGAIQCVQCNVID